MLTIYGVLALSFMMLMYALEGRGKIFTLGFAISAVPASGETVRGARRRFRVTLWVGGGGSPGRDEQVG